VSLIILSDGKMGHLNQSLAYAHYLKCDYEIVQVAFRGRFAKALSYLLDHLGIYWPQLYKEPISFHKHCDGVVATGSTTLYALKMLAKAQGVKAVSLMDIGGYSRRHIDCIYRQLHDGVSSDTQAVLIPVNFAKIDPQGIFKSQGDTVAIVVGGNTKKYSIDKEALKEQIQAIFKRYEGFKFALTTSPRTPFEIEQMLRGFSWDYALYYSQTPQNPIADFLTCAKVVAVTNDSTSMMSEAAVSKVEFLAIIDVIKEPKSKFYKMAEFLVKKGHASWSDEPKPREPVLLEQYAKKGCL